MVSASSSGLAMRQPQSLVLLLPGDSAEAIPDIPFTLVWDRHRTLRLKVTDQGVLVKAPHRMKAERVLQLIQKKRRWLWQTRQAMADSTPGSEHDYQDGDSFFFLGQAYRLHLRVFCPRQGTNAAMPPPFRRALLVRLYGKELEIWHKGSPTLIRAAIQDWRKQTAERICRKRMRRLHAWSCAVLGDELPLPELRIRRMKSRWGICSRKRGITLASSLCALPLILIDFVILHELCHLREMNHGPAFHRLLDQLMPDNRKLCREQFALWRFAKVHD